MFNQPGAGSSTLWPALRYGILVKSTCVFKVLITLHSQWDLTGRKNIQHWRWAVGQALFTGFQLTNAPGGAMLWHCSAVLPRPRLVWFSWHGCEIQKNFPPFTFSNFSFSVLLCSLFASRRARKIEIILTKLKLKGKPCHPQGPQVI